MSCTQPGLRLGLSGQPQGTVLSPFSTDVRAGRALAYRAAGHAPVMGRLRPAPGQPSSTRAASSCQLGSVRGLWSVNTDQGSPAKVRPT